MKKMHPKTDVQTVASAPKDNLQRRSGKIMTMKKMTLCIAMAALPMVGSALTLDEAVENQLGLGFDGLPCGELRDGFDAATNNNRFEGGLLEVCSAAVPAGAVGGSEGGGASTPVSTPSVMSESVEAALDESTEEADKSIELSNNLSLFFNVEVETIERDRTEFEHGYESDLSRFIIGLTYSPAQNLAFSGALENTSEGGDFDSDGDFDQKTKSGRFLTVYRPSQKASISLLAGFDKVDASRKRNASFNFIFNGVNLPAPSIDGTIKADYDYSQYGLSLIADYEIQRGALLIVPEVGLNWSKADYGTYSETGSTGIELTFHDDERESLNSVIGFRASRAIPASFGTVIPQLNLAWHHEFSDDQREAEVSFTQDSLSERFTYETSAPDRDFANLGLGVVLGFKNGIQAFASMETMLEHDYYDRQKYSLGARFEL